MMHMEIDDKLAMVIMSIGIKHSMSIEELIPAAVVLFDMVAGDEVIAKSVMERHPLAGVFNAHE